MDRNALLPELERLIQMLEEFILNFGLPDGPKIDDIHRRLDIIRLLEVLCESKQYIFDTFEDDKK